MDRITNFFWARKGLLEPYFLALIVVLVGLCAFGLGHLSAGAGEGPRLVITYPETTTSAQTAAVGNAAAPQPAAGGAYVASKSGTKYYLPTCSGAARIKETNKVWFATTAEAEAAGYEPAATCPGL